LVLKQQVPGGCRGISGLGCGVAELAPPAYPFRDT
jgi:hypothetical protein